MMEIRHSMKLELELELELVIGRSTSEFDDEFDDEFDFGGRSITMPNNWSVTHHHVALRVRDLRASIEFYQEVLGLELLRALPDADNPTMVWFPGVQLIQKTDADGDDEGWRFAHLAFQTVNCANAVAELQARGLKFLPHEEGKPWFFYDPDGTLIELLP